VLSLKSCADTRNGSVHRRRDVDKRRAIVILPMPHDSTLPHVCSAHGAPGAIRGRSAFVGRFPDRTIDVSRQDRRRRRAYTDGTPILGTGTRAPLGGEGPTPWRRCFRSAIACKPPNHTLVSRAAARRRFDRCSRLANSMMCVSITNCCHGWCIGVVWRQPRQRSRPVPLVVSEHHIARRWGCLAALLVARRSRRTWHVLLTRGQQSQRPRRPWSHPGAR
jgi:hypothetical protein